MLLPFMRRDSYNFIGGQYSLHIAFFYLIASVSSLRSFDLRYMLFFIILTYLVGNPARFGFVGFV